MRPALRPSELPSLLAGAEAPRSHPKEAAAALASALAADPTDPELRLAAYRFHFYNHDYAEALSHGAWLTAHAARRLNTATDWRDVRPGDAAFTAPEFAPGLFLQCLIAMGYCAARLGNTEDAEAMLAKAFELDPTDRFGGGRLLRVIRKRDTDGD